MVDQHPLKIKWSKNCQFLTFKVNICQKLSESFSFFFIEEYQFRGTLWRHMKICSSEFRKILATLCRCPQVVCCEMNIWWTSTPYCVVWIHLNLMSSMSLHSVTKTRFIILRSSQFYLFLTINLLVLLVFILVCHLSRFCIVSNILEYIFGLWFQEEFRVWILFLKLNYCS